MALCTPAPPGLLAALRATAHGGVVAEHLETIPLRALACLQNLVLYQPPQGISHVLRCLRSLSLTERRSTG
jgi:hypothetical protein